MAPMQLEIITAERILFDGEVDAVVAPGSEGELGILPHHAPLMTMLQAGELRYRIGDEETYFALSGGFMEVTSDRVTVLADAAERADEIDEARAQEAMSQAQEACRSHDLALQRSLFEQAPSPAQGQQGKDEAGVADGGEDAIGEVRSHATRPVEGSLFEVAGIWGIVVRVGAEADEDEDSQSSQEDAADVCPFSALHQPIGQLRHGDVTPLW